MKYLYNKDLKKHNIRMIKLKNTCCLSNLHALNSQNLMQGKKDV